MVRVSRLLSFFIHLSHRKKVFVCFIILTICLLVIFKTTLLAVQYEKLVNSLSWEHDRCIYKQGLDSKGRLGPENLYSFFTLPEYSTDLCTISPVVFEHSPRHISVRARPETREELSSKLSTLLWPISVTSDPWPVCVHYYDEAFVFSLPRPPSEGVHYTLLVNTLLPLYSLISLRNHFGPHSLGGYDVVLMPTLEMYGVKAIDWTTDIFSEKNKLTLLQQMLDTFAGSMQVMPFTRHSLVSGRTSCFMSMHFGFGTVNVSDPYLIQGFSSMIMDRLSLPQTPHPQPLVCLVKRIFNRRILNEDELVAAVSSLVQIHIVQFEGLSFREQVSQMQRCTILIGFHGDELLNAIYMPRGSVTIQLLPFKPKHLNPSKYSDIVKSKGHYLEWTNTMKDNFRPSQGVDEIVDQDTAVDVGAFVSLVQDALKLGINKKQVFHPT